MRERRRAALVLLLFLSATAAFAQVDVMFQDDFENMPNGATPDMFLPSGSANPDWDNQILNPFNGGIHANWIDYDSRAPDNRTPKVQTLADEQRTKVSSWVRTSILLRTGTSSSSTTCT